MFHFKNIKLNLNCLHLCNNQSKQKCVTDTEDWRDGSEAKSTVCFCRGPGFKPQLLPGGSQLSVTPAPGDPLPSTGLLRHCTQMVHRQT